MPHHWLAFSLALALALCAVTSPYPHALSGRHFGVHCLYPRLALAVEFSTWSHMPEPSSLALFGASCAPHSLISDGLHRVVDRRPACNIVISRSEDSILTLHALMPRAVLVMSQVEHTLRVPLRLAPTPPIRLLGPTSLSRPHACQAMANKLAEANSAGELGRKEEMKRIFGLEF